MATVAAPAKLTLGEFETLYGDSKPHYEYWDEEARQKTKPTLLHGLLQKIMMLLLDDLGSSIPGSEWDGNGMTSCAPFKKSTIPDRFY